MPMVSNEIRYVCANCYHTFMDIPGDVDRFCDNCGQLVIPITHELFYYWECVKHSKINQKVPMAGKTLC
jgi:hypothetical protein